MSYKLKLYPTRNKADCLAGLTALFHRAHSDCTVRMGQPEEGRPLTCPSSQGLGEFVGRAYRRAWIDYRRTLKAARKTERPFTPPTLHAELIDSADLQAPKHATEFDYWILIKGTKDKLYIPARSHCALNRTLALPGAQLNLGTKGSAQVFRKNGKWYATVTVTVPIPEVQEPKGWLGCDVGARAAVTRSDGYRGPNLRPTLKQHKQRRADQQRNGIDRSYTMSPQRHILAREARKAVTVCLRSGRGLAVEDPSRLIRWKGHAARFFAKRALLLAAIVGVAVQPVPPPYTSTDCSKCGAGQGFRRREMFRCLSCGNTKNADDNASINISHRAHDYCHSHHGSLSLLPSGGGADE